MDFFEHQDIARRNTVKLIVLMITAVVAIVALTYPVICFAIWAASNAGGSENGSGSHAFGEAASGAASGGLDPSVFLQPHWILLVTGCVAAVVLLGSLYKIAELRAGGKVVAEMLGGKLIASNTRDLDERKILNVVEEMAIASGVPVPPVYMLEGEQGINAFAAGHSPDDAVIGVTRGCVQLLSRDELQGVMGHEFSHILNGDMRMNIRLIGIVHGILLIGLIGGMLIRIGFYSEMFGGSRRRNNQDNNGNAALVLALAGVGLFILGFVGVFFGNLIKAAVSRQREFLADASAVQFTRNPAGISGALQKIGGLQSRGLLQAPRAAEASHMYFAEGVSHLLGFMMATHPPLPQRISRVDPSWNGVFPGVQEPATHAYEQRVQQHRDEEHRKRERAFGILAGGAVIASGGASGGVSGGASGTMAQRIAAVRQAAAQRQTPQNPSQPAGAAHTIGNVSDEHIAYAQVLLDSIPDAVREAARDPFGARAVIYGLLLDASDPQVRAAQWRQIETQAEHGVPEELHRIEDELRQVDPAAMMPLVELTLGSLRHLSPQQYEAFGRNVGALIEADRSTSLFEWALQRMLMRHLAPTFEGLSKPKIKYDSLDAPAARRATAVLLSTLVYTGNREMDAAQAAFTAAASKLSVQVQLLDPSQCGLGPLSQALDELTLVALRAKKRLIEAAAAAIAADREVTLKESEMLRVICDSLDCPMPPLLPGQPLG